MRAVVIAALAACVLGGAAGGLPENSASPRLAQSEATRAQSAKPEVKEWRWKQCRFQGVYGPLWTAREEYLTARCVTDRWDVPGGLPRMLAVGSCESGWWRFARNGRYVGLFQQDEGAWPSRLRSHEPRYWTLNPSPWNSRSQIVVAAHMAREDGTWAMSQGGDWADACAL